MSMTVCTCIVHQDIFTGERRRALWWVRWRRACANNGDNSPTKNASLKTLLQTIVR